MGHGSSPPLVGAVEEAQLSTPHRRPSEEEYLVTFDGDDDPLNAQNWSFSRKLLSTANLAYATLLCTMGSAVFAPATDIVALEYHTPRLILVLGTSLYVLGFAGGPSFWAPLCELRGRKSPLVASMFGFSVFEIGTAASSNVPSILICRLFAGLFAAGPMSITAACMADMWSNRVRGTAVSAFSMSVFIGPFLAQVLGSYIAESRLGWRWTHYVMAIMGGLSTALLLLFLRESYAPVLLVHKAKHLRLITRNWALHAAKEEELISLKDILQKYFARPLRLLFTEPIVFVTSLYSSFIFGLMYLLLSAYPASFSDIHHFDLGTSSLPYLALVIGMILGGFFVVCHQPWYSRQLAANNNVTIPEWRLFPAMYGALFFAVGLFWFGWTGYTEDIHWALPTSAGLVIGFGLFSLFLPILNYLIDSYVFITASVVAANTILRSIAGAVFPLFATQMIDAMGIKWACTLLGCVATVLMPIPVVFYFLGRRIRVRSRWACHD